MYIIIYQVILLQFTVFNGMHAHHQNVRVRVRVRIGVRVREKNQVIFEGFDTKTTQSVTVQCPTY